MSFIFGGGGSSSSPTPKPQPVAAPTRMPVPNSALSRAAAGRQNRNIFGRSGRRSTILSRRDGEQGGSYRNSLLGQA